MPHKKQPKKKKKKKKIVVDNFDLGTAEPEFHK